MLTNEQLAKLGLDPEWLDPLNETFAKYDISTPKRQACFIGQCMHESGGFKQLNENLNYSAKALVSTWPSRFPDLEYASEYERKPERIANKVYGGRMGNTEEGDGWKYHGRGLIQLTGKENYDNCGSGIGVDLLGNPDWLSDPKYSLPAVIVVGVWKRIGFAMVVFAAGLAALPISTYEAAALDGAQGWKAIRYITIPLLKPIILVVLITGFIDAIQVFDHIFVMTGGGPMGSTQVLSLLLYNQGFRLFNLGVASAIGWIILTFVLVITLSQRLLSRIRNQNV